MIIQICVAIVSIAFVTLSVFACVAILAMRKSLNEIRVDLNRLTIDGSELIKNVNELNEDIKKKSESLDFIFQYLNAFNGKKLENESEDHQHHNKSTEIITEIVSLVETGVNFVKKIKGDIIKYVK